MLDISKLRKIFIISLLIITGFAGCDDNDYWIPNVPVNIRIPLTRLSDLGLLQARYWPGGVNGIIIFRRGDREFNAFDRTCTFQPSENCAVVIMDDLFAECPCCGSQFHLSFEYPASPEKGPAKRPLKQYRTTVDGQRLHISN